MPLPAFRTTTWPDERFAVCVCFVSVGVPSLWYDISTGRPCWARTKPFARSFKKALATSHNFAEVSASSFDRFFAASANSINIARIRPPSISPAEDIASTRLPDVTAHNSEQIMLRRCRLPHNCWP